MKYEINNVHLLGKEECSENKGIFPSDHYALIAEINISSVKLKKNNDL